MDSSEKPQVSVVMSAYNTEKYLAEAIESVLNQTFKNFEFIIIDDGSKDKTLEIIKSYAKKDPRIRFRSRPNKGMPCSLNEGIKMAKGKFIARQDSDDISKPDRLEKQIKYLNAHPEVGLLGTNLQRVDTQLNFLNYSDMLTHPDDLKLAEIFSNQFGHGSVVIRRSTLQKSGLYNPRIKIAEDYDLWARVSRVSKVANLKEPLYIWRAHEKSISSSRVPEIVKSAYNTRDWGFKYYVNHKLEYKFFSFHPFSMNGGVVAYMKKKAHLYRMMALMYCYDGYRRQAVPLLLFACLCAPWVVENYKQLFLTLSDRKATLRIKYTFF